MTWDQYLVVAFVASPFYYWFAVNCSKVIVFMSHREWASWKQLKQLGAPIWLAPVLLPLVVFVKLVKYIGRLV